MPTQCLYTVEEARRRLRFGDWAWRKIRRSGLIVLRVSGGAFVTGREVIDFIERHGRETANDCESTESEPRHNE
jgi:hypothetical protein